MNILLTHPSAASSRLRPFGFAGPLRSALWLSSGLLLAACAQHSSSTGASAAMSAEAGPASLNVADAAIAGGNPTMALSVSQSVLQNDPGNVDALEHEGDAYYALNRCPAAMAAYQLALTHNPSATEAQTGLGRCLLKTDPHAAELAFDAGIQDDPGNADALNDLGIARDLQGNFAGAVEPYQKALLADPSMTAGEVNLGLSLALSGNGPEALQYLGPLATGPNATPKIREDYAAALVASGRSDEARQVLAIDLPPDKVETALNGFASVIAASQQPPPPPAPPAPTLTTAPATPVAAAPLTPVAPAPVSVAPPAPTPVAVAPPPPPAKPVQLVSASASEAVTPPTNPDAAYTGPSPIPVTASSSTPGPVAPASAPADTTSNPAAADASADASAAPASAGGVMVQLAALPSSAEAQHIWTRISNGNPSLFGDKSPIFETATVKGETYYRLRVGGFDTAADAAKFCRKVKASGHACTVANF
jgi:Flp pilus assembly protein TadD